MQEDGEANGHVSISTGRDFFEKREPLTPPVMEEAQAAELGATIPDDSAEQVAADLIERATPPDADVHLSDKPSPYDPLFDDDAEGEDIATTLSAPLPDSPIPSKKDAGSPPRSQPSATMLTHPAGQPSATPTASTALFASAQVASSSRPGAAETIPVLSPASYNNFSEDVLLTSSMDGQVVLIDRRVPVYAGSGGGVGRLLPAEKAPPWCMSVRSTRPGLFPVCMLMLMAGLLV